ncbi:MBL fold metallo-hydrolase [Bacillus sp. T3]|uniref:MBL fold metallo-hydrolase n=1 Tax=Bacillus sp. T3 TaxID=467262 RepID=UPI002982293F|nr:MBL fold metallo-hydrolase [Bacillus sp. T3]
MSVVVFKENGVEIIPIHVSIETGLKSINFYLIKHGKSLSLIDAGYNNEPCWDTLLSTLAQNDLELEDLTEIILTHHHADHIGLVNPIVSKHPIPVYASPSSIPRLKRDENFLKMRIEFFSKLYSEMGCGELGVAQVHFLKEAIQKNKDQALQCEIIEIKERNLFDFLVLPVPGHAPDQLAFFNKDHRWLFVGDLLIDHIASNAIVEPDCNGNRIHTLSQHIHSLKSVLALKPLFVFSGHGKNITQPEHLIMKRLDRIEEKSDRILSLIDSGVKTGSELAQSIYKKRYSTNFSLVMSEIIGHLDYLEVQGKIQKIRENEIWRYAKI